MSQTTPQGIPIRKVYLQHLSELPHDYGTTPGGTLFSTTPGGTRIIYDRSFLLKCRASPLSNTPPSNLPDIPGVTSPEKPASKLDGKIMEETGAQLGKENGGNIQQGGAAPPQFAAPAYGFDVYASSKSPLQQYRQRNFIQQNNGFYEKNCQEINEVPATSNFLNRGVSLLPSAPCNPAMPIQQPACINTHNSFVGDGSWQDTYDVVSVPAVRKTCPTSQLSLWRQNKMNQTAPQPYAMPVNTAAQLPQTNIFPPGHPGLSIYRGVSRGYSNGIWPDSLCDPLEKLFKAHSGGTFLPGQAIPYANYTPAYGQFDYNREAGVQYDNASVMQ